MGNCWTARGEVELEINDDLSIYVEFLAEFVRDSNYGADADGNRGVSRDFLEGLYIEKATESNDGKEVELTEEQKEAATKLAEDAAWDWEPEGGY